MANCLIPRISLLVSLIALSTSLLAQELIDPTRPAVSLESASAVAAVQGTDELNAGQGLSLIIIKDSRRAAVIDGRIIELGGRYGTSKLIEVNANNVVLQSATGQRVMRLYPAVEMTLSPHAPVSSNKKTSSGQPQVPPIAIKEKK
ncbi:MAG: hypothetical protein RL358_265 [Pseudomonadota bacterium]|jgi:hypothetical protein